MSYEPVGLVQVRVWGRDVGVLAPAGTRRSYVFEYEPAWGRNGADLAPILMPRTPRGTFTFPDLDIETWRGLPPMIADSLPDAFGNALIDAWMAREGVAREQITALDRLAYLGRRGMGALEYVPDTGPRHARASAIDMSELIVAARAAVQGHLADDKHAQSALQQIIDVGTSAGGQRAKAIVNWNPATQEIHSGHLPPEPGFEPWLLKFDGVGEDRQLGTSQVYGRIEYAYSLMAAAAGITTAQTRLLEENGRAHFMSRRFDRTPTGDKVHMQSLCALSAVDYRLRGANDYAQLLAAIETLGLDDETKTEALHRAAFNVATMNCDDHSKNFAFLLPPDGTWSLSPAYDVTFAYNPAGKWNNQHLMAVNGKFMNITRDDLLTLADRYAIPRAASAVDGVLAAVESWPSFAAKAGLPARTADEIAQQFRLADLRPRRRRAT